MINTRILEKVKESKNLYHIYVEDDLLYMIRVGDYTTEIEKAKILHEKGVNFAGPISQVKYDDIEKTAEFLIEKIITPQL